MKKNISLGKKIKNTREKLGLTTKEFAKRLKIKESKLIKYESDKVYNHNQKLLKRLSKITDLDYEELLYSAGLGYKITPLNPFIAEYYLNIKYDDISNTIDNINKEITDNEKIIKLFKSCLKNKEVKEMLLEKIKELEYRNDTNRYIIKLLESRIIHEDLKRKRKEEIKKKVRVKKK
ncbi:MAG: helix-turn-helix transcriptional regulator [bacterium]|nr:helix-turn-helix transcriptional regulator [bacterium]